MRCFIAIDISEQIKAQLADVQQELAGSVDIRQGDVKWVRPEAMHLTLKFLGEVRDADVVEICRIARDAAGRHRAFNVAVKEVGHFGGRSARVLWVGAGAESEPLSALQQDLEEQLAEAGWPKEGRKFSAHLTLCRVRNTKAGAKLAEATGPFRDLDLGAMRADSVSVYESKLTPQGPIYTCLGNYKLR
ncbi:MAG: RNA 2',3'-cyclic phosphodiesterase [Sedimentisphaerales bacterium]|nr:RNA 2',3'-cyclic phosphodiesterase [Sedimentisphaerales bacterium]